MNRNKTGKIKIGKLATMDRNLLAASRSQTCIVLGKQTGELIRIDSARIVCAGSSNQRLQVTPNPTAQICNGFDSVEPCCLVRRDLLTSRLFQSASCKKHLVGQCKFLPSTNSQLSLIHDYRRSSRRCFGTQRLGDPNRSDSFLNRLLRLLQYSGRLVRHQPQKIFKRGWIHCEV